MTKWCGTRDAYLTESLKQAMFMKYRHHYLDIIYRDSLFKPEDNG